MFVPTQVRGGGTNNFDIWRGGGQTFLPHRGGQTFLPHRGGDKHFYTERGGDKHFMLKMLGVMMMSMGRRRM